MYAKSGYAPCCDQEGGNVNEFYEAGGPVTINQGEDKLIMEIDGSLYRTILFVVSINDNNLGDYFSAELLAHHDGTDADHTQYAMLGPKTVRLYAEYAGGMIQLKGIGLQDGQIVKAIAFKVGV